MKKISIEYIDKKDFVKKCFTECSSEIGCKFPHYFDKNIEQIERFKNFANLRILIFTQINDIIMNCLPTDQISASNRNLRRKTPSPRKQKIPSPKKEKEIIKKVEIIPSPPKNTTNLRKSTNNTKRSFPIVEVPKEIDTKVITKSLSTILRKSQDVKHTRYLIIFFSP